MKFIFQWLGKKIQQSINQSAGDQETIENFISKPVPILGSRDVIESNATLNFTIYNAIGGKVVEFKRYDKHNDRGIHTIYVIPKNEDFGERISKIATLECLKD